MRLAPRPGTMVGMAGSDAIFELINPFLRAVLGLCVALAVIVATYRLARRGRSRMRTAMLVIGAAIVGLAALGILMGGG